MAKAATRTPTGRLVRSEPEIQNLPGTPAAALERAAAGMPPKNGKPADELKTPLPSSLTAALPSAGKIVAHITAIEALTVSLSDELERSAKGGAVALARAFVVLHRLHERSGRSEKSKVGVALIGKLFETFKNERVPHAFEVEGVPNVPLSEGYRVGVSTTKRASILAGMQEGAKQWLRDNNYADIISETINASTLSSFAKNLQEDHNKELPDELFNVVDLPTTSVTKT